MMPDERADCWSAEHGALVPGDAWGLVEYGLGALVSDRVAQLLRTTRCCPCGAACGGVTAFPGCVQAAVNASARQQEEQLGEGDGAEARVSALQPPGRSPGRASSASPSGTLIAALVGSVVVLVILAAATVVALLLLQRHRKRAGDGGQRRGLRGIDAAAPAGRENGHIGGGDNSAYAMQVCFHSPRPAPPRRCRHPTQSESWNLYA